MTVDARSPLTGLTTTDPQGTAAVRPRRRTGRVHPAAWYVLRRLGVGLLLLIAVSVVVFWGTQVLPGDAAAAVLGRSATPEAIENLRQELGLDRPLVVQYLDWASGLIRGDLGAAIGSGQPVVDYIRPRLINTAILGAIAFVIMIPLSLALGVWSALRQDRAADQAIGGVSLAFIAIPEFVTGTLLIALLAVYLGLLPPVSLVTGGRSPLETPEILVLPALTLLLAGSAFIIRMVRAGVIQVLESEFVAMARLNGLPERRVVLRHVLPNSLAPTVQVIALTALWLVGGVVLVETVFQYPGLGQGLVEAVRSRDIPTVQGIAMLVAALYIVINIAADVVVAFLIPKIRTTL